MQSDKYLFEKGKIKMFNYNEAVKADVLEYIRNNYTAEELAEKMEDKDEFAEELNDTLWIEDSVTGNGSGSYTFSRAAAKDYVTEDPDTVLEAVREFCSGMDSAELLQKFLCEDWEYFDVTARCYCLNGAIYEALEELAA
jgi:hypothetical protein